MEKQYDYLFKLLFIGDSNVGKTSLLVRFADDIFSEKHVTTIGVDFKIKESFKAVEKWFDEAKKHSGDKTVKFLVGNKTDLESERKVTFEEGKALADSKGINFIETSAKKALEVDTMFYDITKQIISVANE